MLAAPPGGRTTRLKGFAVLLAVVALLMPTGVGAGSDIEIVSYSGDGYWDGNTWYVSLCPGETAETTLTLKNNTSKAVTVRLDVIPDENCDDEVEFWWDSSELTIPRHSTADDTFYANVSGSAPPGKYTAELTIKCIVSPLSVATRFAWPVTWHSAVSHGRLSDMGTASSVNVYFEWGETTGYGSRTRVRRITHTGRFSAVIGGLRPGTTYHFRAVAEAKGMSYGSDRSFRTKRHWWRPWW